MSGHLLIVGHGGKGSFAIRGRQIGAALGARVTAKPTGEDWAWADVVILVKHAAERWGHEAKASGATVIWDVLDWWQQPEENQIPIADMVAKVHAVRDRFGFHQLIGATQAMADDIGGVYLPHHSRPGLTPAPIREQMKVVAYEGQAKYLGSWKKAIQKACDELGLTFVINPPDLRDADVVVAFRGEEWDGPICHRWKSGVKFVNAVAAGRPVVSHMCLGRWGMSGLSGIYIDTASELVNALGQLGPVHRRLKALTEATGAVNEHRIDTVARQYRQMIVDVVRRAA